MSGLQSSEGEDAFGCPSGDRATGQIRSHQRQVSLPRLFKRGAEPACAWFLEITFMPPKYVFVCVHPRGHK